jgi:hypothetical protein
MTLCAEAGLSSLPSEFIQPRRSAIHMPFSPAETTTSSAVTPYLIQFACKEYFMPRPIGFCIVALPKL